MRPTSMATRLTYRLIAFDTGMTIDAATGLIQWTPTAAQIGLHAHRRRRR